MKVPIRVESIEQMPDGSARVNIEFDDELKPLLMQEWGITEWDDARAQKEFLKVISEHVMKENTNASEG